MHKQVGARKVAGNCNPRIDGVTIQQKLIVVPAQSGTDRPVLQANLILYESRLLKVWPVSKKAEVNRSVVVKLGRIGDVIAKIFVQECVVRLESKFPFVPSMIDGGGAPEVGFAEEIVLEDLDRRGGCWS